MTVSQMLDSKLERDNKQRLCDDLELNKVLEREVSHLSGGELQRFAIAMSCIQRADVCVPFFLFGDVALVFSPDTCLMSPQVTWTSNND